MTTTLNNSFSVSVVIAAFHGEKFIGELLKSLFTQTYPPSEILIGDDSHDNQTEIAIRNVIAEAPCPVNIIKNEQPKGCSQNFSMLADKATGDIIFLCDQDDVWLPEKIENMVNEFKQFPETAVVFCNSRFVDCNLNDMGYSTSDILKISNEVCKKINEENDLLDFIKNPMMYGHNIAFRKEFRNCFLPIPEYVNIYDLYINYIAVCSHIRCIRKDLTLFRRHGNNSSVQQTSWQRLIRILTKKNDKERYNSWIHIYAAIEKLKTIESVSKMENFNILCKFRDFYKKRLKVSSGNIFKRLQAITFLNEYFQCGTGIKSFLRDIFIRNIINEDQFSPESLIRNKED